MMKVLSPRYQNFYPRPPRGGRHKVLVKVPGSKVFLSTPSARRATVETYLDANSWDISIHALREEGDAVRTACARFVCKFLSTPSARRATVS